MFFARSNPPLLALGSAAICAVGLSACGPSNTKYPISSSEEAKWSRSTYQTAKEANSSIFARDGIAADFSPGALFGDEEQAQSATGPSTAGIRVNGYLWGAALDAVSFMPIDNADPEAGIVQTGWYIPPDAPNERLKVNVFVLSGDLRDDGVRVGVFRQIRDGDGTWSDAAPSPGTQTTLEDLIVRRARELQVASSG